MYRISALLLIVATLEGCVMKSDTAERFADKHYTIDEKSADKLEGPYKLKRVATSTVIVVEKDSREVNISFRGCAPTGDAIVERQAIKSLGPLLPGEIYLLKESIFQKNPEEIKAVVYIPANQVYEGQDEKGRSKFRNLTYRMPQLLRLLHGEVLFDESDSGYPLRDIFKEAQEIAKQNREGHWKTQ